MGGTLTVAARKQHLLEGRSQGLHLYVELALGSVLIS